MSDRKKKHPALELPGIFIKSVLVYLGPRKVNKLTTAQMFSISRACTELAGMVVDVVEDDAEIKVIEHQRGDNTV